MHASACLWSRCSRCIEQFTWQRHAFICCKRQTNQTHCNVSLKETYFTETVTDADCQLLDYAQQLPHNVLWVHLLSLLSQYSHNGIDSGIVNPSWARCGLLLLRWYLCKEYKQGLCNCTIWEPQDSSHVDSSHIAAHVAWKDSNALTRKWKDMTDVLIPWLAQARWSSEYLFSWGMIDS